MPSAVAQFLSAAFPAIARDPGPLDCWVWKVVQLDPPQLGNVSDAIQVVDQHGQLLALQRRVRNEHTGRRAHRADDDERLMDCLTEACAFAWADMRALVPTVFDYRPGKPDIHVPPELWIEAKSIHQSQASAEMMAQLRAETLLGGSVAPPERNRRAAFLGALADAQKKFERLGSGQWVVFSCLPDVDVEQWADRPGVLARYTAWLDQIERANPSVSIVSIVFIHHYDWRNPVRDPFA